MQARVALGLLLLALTWVGTLDAQTPRTLLTGDTFVAALEQRLGLDWGPCPPSLAALDDVRCAVIGQGDPFAEAEALGLVHARAGGDVLDVEFDDGLPDHRFAGRVPSVRPIRRLPGCERLVYLISEQHVSLWIETGARPPAEVGERERWLAVRVDPLDGPFPDYLLAPARPGR